MAAADESMKRPHPVTQTRSVTISATLRLFLIAILLLFGFLAVSGYLLSGARLLG